MRPAPATPAEDPADTTREHLIVLPLTQSQCCWQTCQVTSEEDARDEASTPRPRRREAPAPALFRCVGC